ncbi:MAG: chemotaxis protein CheB [Lysobacterales bacterium]
MPMSTEIRVALIYQQDAGTSNLRSALANAGVQIAMECKADALAHSPLAADNVDAIVVNLDPELEDLLDEVTEALETAPQPVIFNDPAASSDLSGWDRARWLRHLSAKLKGRTDVTPPPPPGAAVIPNRAPRPAPVISAEPTPMPEVEAPAPAVELAAATAQPVTDALDFAALDALLFESTEAAAPPPSATKPETAVPSDAEFDLDGLFEAPKRDSAAVDTAALDVDLDTLFDAPAEPVAPARAMDAPIPADQAGLVTGSELAELDALFSEFSAELSDAPAAPPSTQKPEAAPPAAAKSSAEPRDFSALDLNWSLEPLETPEQAPKKMEEKLVAEWRLDAPAKPLSAEPPKPAAAPVPARAAAALPSHLEESLALSDLRLLDDLDTPTAHTGTAASASDAEATGIELEDLGALDLDSIEFAMDEPAPAAAGSANGAADGDLLSVADLDFALDLGDTPSGPAGKGAFGDDLSDLDSLFEPVAAVPVIGLSLPDLNRVFVLGASIGGPEAIKAFLARLPASVPAAFVVAQHMGAEFLQMMAAQLDGATQLKVRFAAAGERLRHGEVVVAPANERLVIDETGHLRTSAAASSPYNPSIDQLVRDAVDRFGDQVTLILFSGMGADAVEGGRYLTERGGQVWAQERSSCVIASMIDAARAQGLIRFEGTPAELADRVLQVLA